MADVVYWPSNLQDVVPKVLPQPQRGGYGYQSRDRVLSTDFGLITRRRRVHRQVPSDVRLAFKLTSNQWDYFEGFYDFELNAGERWFCMPLMVRGAIRLVDIMFLEEPPFNLRGVDGGEFSIAAVTRRSTVMSADEWALIKQFAGSDNLRALLQALNEFANTEYS